MDGRRSAQGCDVCVVDLVRCVALWGVEVSRIREVEEVDGAVCRAENEVCRCGECEGGVDCVFWWREGEPCMFGFQGDGVR